MLNLSTGLGSGVGAYGVGFTSWSFPLVLATSINPSYNPAVSVARVTRIPYNGRPYSYSHINFFLVTNSVAFTHAYVAIWDASYTLICQSSNQYTSFNDAALQWVSMDLGGIYIASDDIFVGLWTAGSTACILGRQPVTTSTNFLNKAMTDSGIIDIMNAGDYTVTDHTAPDPLPEAPTVAYSTVVPFFGLWGDSDG